MLKNIKIVQSPTTLTSKSRTIEFYDMHCVEVNDNFNGVDNQPMTTTITLSPAIISVNGETMMEKYWKVSDLTTVTPIQQEQEPERVLVFESAHFEDEQGNKIDEKYRGMATLIIRTKNSSDKTIDVDLSSREHDFKYKGKILKKDILPNVRLTGNITKVQLEIIDEQN